MSGTFLSFNKGVKYRFEFQEGTWDFSRDSAVGRGLTWQCRGNLMVSRVAVGFSSYNGECREPIVLPQKIQSLFEL